MEHGRSGRAVESLEGAQPNPHWMTGAISWLLSVDNDMGCMPKAYGPVRYHVNREREMNGENRMCHGKMRSFDREPRAAVRRNTRGCDDDAHDSSHSSLSLASVDRCNRLKGGTHSMMNLNKIETVTPVATNAISDRDRPVVTTTMYGLIAAIQSTLGPDDERVVTTVTRILRTGCATFQHLATYRLSA